MRWVLLLSIFYRRETRDTVTYLWKEKRKKAKTWQNEDLELGILFPDSMCLLTAA